MKGPKKLMIRGWFCTENNWFVLKLTHPQNKKVIKVFLIPSTSKLVYKQTLYCEGTLNGTTSLSIEHFTCHYRLANDGNKKISLNRLYNLLIGFKPSKSIPVFPIRVNVNYGYEFNSFKSPIYSICIDFYSHKNFQGTFFSMKLGKCSNCALFSAYYYTVDGIIATKCLTLFDIIRLFMPNKGDK